MTTTGVELRDVQAETINIHDVTVGVTEDELVAALERRGLLAGAELAGLQKARGHHARPAPQTCRAARF